MFTQKWRQHWGLTEDPFACEDADKDVVLDAVEASAVHSGFDRIFGTPRVPAPGIVFGEKGSGKSGLRRMMVRHLEQHNAEHDGERLFLVEYIDFDGGIEHFRGAIGASGSAEKAADQVVKRWGVADHLDSILSLGITKLADSLIDGHENVHGLTRKQRIDFLVLAGLYYSSPRRTGAEAVKRLRGRLGVHSLRPVMRFLLAMLVTAAGIGVALFPQIQELETEHVEWFYGAGAAVVFVAWIAFFLSASAPKRSAHKATKSLRSLAVEHGPLSTVLAGMGSRQRAEFGLPALEDEAARYDLLQRFLNILESCGYAGAYVLMDRVDEPSLLSGDEQRMRAFVERILQIKLLQFPKLALKLFLPIEMETLYQSASPEELKRMRLDKSNLIPELKWTGEELYEIADQRLRACTRPDAKVERLSDLFEEGFDLHHLRETLTTLGTPRYAFGFLSAAFTEYVRELPGELEPDDPRWRLSRGHFDVVRGAWVDRTGLLRRSLN